jgi:heat shock protein HtpX
VTATYLLALLAVGTHIVPITANVLLDAELAVPSTVGGSSIVVAVGGVVAGSLWLGHGLQRRLLRWRSPTASESERLDPVVSRLSMQFDVAAPTVRVVETEMPNAYTIAPLRGSATVVVTTGLLSTLSEGELSAVLAHELAHVANRDATVLSAVSTGIVLCGIVYRAATRLAQSASDSGDVADFLIEGFLSGVVGLLTLTFWIPAALAVHQLSRSREFLADRAAARATGNPAALASALETVDEAVSTAPDADARSLEPALAPLALVGDAGGTGSITDSPDRTRTVRLDQTILRPVVTHPSVAAWFETHPLTSTRIDRLRDYSNDG